MPKYLCITMHDNDFTSYGTIMGEAIYNICYTEWEYFKEEDIPKIKKYIEHLWYAYHNLVMTCRFGDHEETDFSEFRVYVSIVDDDFIEEYKNGCPNFTHIFIRMEDYGTKDDIYKYVFVI